MLHNHYLPRKYEINAPSEPINERPRIINPMGTRLACVVWSTKVGTASGAGGVKVGRRVDVDCATKAANKVGLIVGVETNVGVGGAGITGKFPPRINDTYGAYTHPMDFGTPK